MGVSISSTCARGCECCCARLYLGCSLTENRTLCDASGELDRAGFELLIRHQLHLYVVRTLAAAMEKVERQQVHYGLAYLILCS